MIVSRGSDAEPIKSAPIYIIIIIIMHLLRAIHPG